MIRFIVPSTLICVRNMAGHSHFQNIRHIKEAKDNIKRELGNKLSIKMKIAVMEGGTSDPKSNTKLNNIIQNAKRNNIPNSTVQSILKKLEASKDKGSVITSEFFGPGNSAFIVESFSDSPIHVRQHIQSVLKKYGLRTVSIGCASHNFSYKGVIKTENRDEAIDMDLITEMALDVGAEDVAVLNQEESNVLQFICDPKDLRSVQENLVNLKQDVLIASHQYMPDIFSQINKSQMDIISKLTNSLETLEFVVNIYNNVDIESLKEDIR